MVTHNTTLARLQLFIVILVPVKMFKPTPCWATWFVPVMPQSPTCCVGTCFEFTPAFTTCRQMNSDQSPSHARCSPSWHKLLSLSLRKRPHSSTTASATVTQNLQSFKFALCSLAVGIRKWNRQGARSVRQALHSFTVSSCSQGCPPTTTLLVLNTDTLHLVWGSSCSQSNYRYSAAPSSPWALHGKNKDERGANSEDFRENVAKATQILTAWDERSQVGYSRDLWLFFIMSSHCIELNISYWQLSCTLCQAVLIQPASILRFLRHKKCSFN